MAPSLSLNSASCIALKILASVIIRNRLFIDFSLGVIFVRFYISVLHKRNLKYFLLSSALQQFKYLRTACALTC